MGRKTYLAPGTKIVWPPEFPIRIWVRSDWAGNSVIGELAGLLGYEFYRFKDHHLIVYFPLAVREQMTPSMASAVYTDCRFASKFFKTCKMIDDC